MGTTTRLALSYADGTTNVSAYPAIDQASMTILDSAALYLEGAFASRPAASLAGRVYRATDVGTAGQGTVYLDTGSTWFTVAPDTPEAAFGSYKTLVTRLGSSIAGPTSGTWLLSSTTGSSGLAALPAFADGTFFYLNPADYTAGARTTKCRIRGELVTNSVAPASNWTFGLYPCSSFGGASGALPTVATIGSAVTGSTGGVVTGPGANSASSCVSADFTAPAAGFYVLAAVNSTNSAAGALVTVRAMLQMRQV